MKAARLYQSVRDFSIRVPVWAQAIRYQTLPDERYDLTLVSRRVYGNPDESLVIQAAAGLESTENELLEQLLTLPGPDQLREMKRRAGYANREIGS
ncbi:hypothetical protein [Nevskia sp.]|uniref:hypothetical protein n=1 Tax=Nevskia sp. TaxID=1929292 RepID=UPI0025E31253|nr:hypothetical protein [Nevskia sp.]